MINDPLPAPLSPEPERDLRAGWLDLQATLKELLYQGNFAIDALPRLESIEKKALELLDWPATARAGASCARPIA
jgi:hypothetical protein